MSCRDQLTNTFDLAGPCNEKQRHRSALRRWRSTQICRRRWPEALPQARAAPATRAYSSYRAPPLTASDGGPMCPPLRALVQTRDCGFRSTRNIHACRPLGHANGGPWSGFLFDRGRVSVCVLQVGKRSRHLHALRRQQQHQQHRKHSAVRLPLQRRLHRPLLHRYTHRPNVHGWRPALHRSYA